MVMIERKSKFISNSNIVVCTVQALFVCVVLYYCNGDNKKKVLNKMCVSFCGKILNFEGAVMIQPSDAYVLSHLYKKKLKIRSKKNRFIQLLLHKANRRRCIPMLWGTLITKIKTIFL